MRVQRIFLKELRLVGGRQFESGREDLVDKEGNPIVATGDVVDENTVAIDTLIDDQGDTVSVRIYKHA